MKKYTIAALLLATSVLSVCAQSYYVAPIKPYGLNLSADGVSVPNGGTLIAKTNGSGSTGTAMLNWGSGGSSFCRISILDNNAITSSAAPDNRPVATGLVNGQAGAMVCTSQDGQTTSLNFTVRVVQSAAVSPITLTARVNGQSVTTGGNITVASAQNLSVAITNSGATNCYFYKDGYDYPLEEKRVALGSQTLTNYNTQVLSNISGKTDYVYHCVNNSSSVTRATSQYLTNNIQFSITIDPSYVAPTTSTGASAAPTLPTVSLRAVTSDGVVRNYTQSNADVRVIPTTDGKVTLTWSNTGATTCSLDSTDIGSANGGPTLFTLSASMTHSYSCTNAAGTSKIVFSIVVPQNGSGGSGGSGGGGSASTAPTKPVLLLNGIAVASSTISAVDSVSYFWGTADALSYKFNVRIDPSSYTKGKVTNFNFLATSTSFKMSDLQINSGIVRLSVAACANDNFTNCSAYSSTTRITVTPLPVPSAPVLLYHGDNVSTAPVPVSSNDTIALSWEVPGAVSYKLWADSTRPAIHKTFKFTTKNTSFKMKDLGITSGTVKVKVKACNSSDICSARYSNTITFTVSAAPLASLGVIGSVLGDSTSCIDLPRNIHRGAEGVFVKQLQSFLTEKGFLDDAITGFYGDKTVTAVKDYQVSRNLPETGMVFDFTRDAIRNETCN